MFSCIYIEASVRNNELALSIIDRFPDVPLVTIDRYGEVFNRKAQNFRLQKLKPALILAKKHSQFVLPAPPGYGFGEGDSYYFSHMLNCIYDCRYCFLQGMYRSANYVLFVNFNDYIDAIEKIAQGPGSEKKYFYSGYDCDSLALEPISGFAKKFIPWFQAHSNNWFELRTKSTQIRDILKLEPVENCVLAYSFTPQGIATDLESKVPALDRRIDALSKLQQSGWPVALRFEPVIYQENLQQVYAELFESVFKKLNPDKIHSVSIGMFRVPKAYFNNMRKLYPEEKLFALDLVESNGLISYRQSLEENMVSQLRECLTHYVNMEKFYHCTIGH